MARNNRKAQELDEALVLIARHLCTVGGWDVPGELTSANIDRATLQAAAEQLRWTDGGGRAPDGPWQLARALEALSQAVDDGPEHRLVNGRSLAEALLARVAASLDSLDLTTVMLADGTPAARVVDIARMLEP
jgi:hypothetical protein